jgi:hypothetical protein
MELSALRQLAQDLHPVRLAAATSKVVTVHTPSMTPGRWIFLVVLAVFFCSLFTGVYVWMRRPTFSEDVAPRGNTTAFDGTISEDGRPMLVRTATQRARTATQEASAAGVPDRPSP